MVPFLFVPKLKVKNNSSNNNKTRLIKCLELKNCIHQSYNVSHILGWFRALMETIQPEIDKRGLAPIAWAISSGQLFDQKRNQFVSWPSEEQMFPIAQHLKNYFQNTTYEKIMKTTQTEYLNQFVIQWDKPPKIIQDTGQH
jgi:hypothetical protein